MNAREVTAQDNIETELVTLKAAADRASGTMNKKASAEVNREAFRALVADCFASFEALAYQLGGDGDYISDRFNGVTSEGGNIDQVFLDLVERENSSEAPFNPRREYSTYHAVNGHVA